MDALRWARPSRRRAWLPGHGLAAGPPGRTVGVAASPLLRRARRRAGLAAGAGGRPGLCKRPAPVAQALRHGV